VLTLQLDPAGLNAPPEPGGRRCSGAADGAPPPRFGPADSRKPRRPQPRGFL